MVGWEIYDRPRQPRDPAFMAARIEFLGWNAIRDKMHPTDAWACAPPANDAWNPKPHRAQAVMLARLEWRYTGKGPCPHPAERGWQLDQDRRCKDSGGGHYTPDTTLKWGE